MTASFSELEFHQKLRENNQQFFLKMVASYEKTIAASMRAQGFKRVNRKRTNSNLFIWNHDLFKKSLEEGKCH